MTVSDSYLEVFEIFKPIFSFMIPLMILPLFFYCFKRVMEVLKGAIGDDYSPSYDSKREPPEPKEDIYFDGRKNGYWVKMSDGSRSFVDMKDLYPNDVDIQSEIKVAQPGNYIWDSTNMKFKEKGVKNEP